MCNKFIISMITMALSAWSCGSSQQGVSRTATGAPAIGKDGWQPLIGKTPASHWHNYLRKDVAGWEIANGILFSGGNNGDLVSNDLFDQFELYVEWKIEKGGNSGIFYHVSEEAQYAGMYQTGPEFQLIDNDHYAEPLQANQVTGSASDVLAPTLNATRPAGSWNTTRILVDRGKVSHWLNGKKILTYDLNSEHWKAAVARSKFQAFDYAIVRSGRLGLQDHGHPVWFRNIRVRRISNVWPGP